ncbi:DUF881 domain-containing protein [Intrasporangium sp.]|uniref:DUF881 domain-containing protein n=1 Tax=Intrasporangium sp. TaxID=1925024 RepID=UPI00293A2BE9|nr:DUF881 domain-containing protein [Intrasporangium sp.]MDV3221485.1 DUF881 domain-containing protein [Intrasporangium sp.]
MVHDQPRHDLDGPRPPDVADGAPPEGRAGADFVDAAAPGPADGRLRLGWRVLVPIVTAAAGTMFAMSFQAAQGEDLRADRDLPALIIEGNTRNEEKAKQLDVLQQEVDALTKASGPKDTRLAALTRQADTIAAAAAATPVQGPAVEVVLDDSDRTLDSLPDRYTADDIVVHQQDVQAVVNALWASGAESMMIQDQRVISTSAVRCVGNTLILQGRVYAPPYRIKAIGDVDAMLRGIDADPVINTYLEYVEAVGLGWEVHTDSSAEFPAYSGAVDLDHASPIR